MASKKAAGKEGTVGEGKVSKRRGAIDVPY